VVKLVIFDHSGVLVDDLKVSWVAISKIVSMGGYKPDDLKAFRRNFKLPHTKYLLDKGFTERDASNSGVVRDYCRYYGELIDRVAIFDDTEETLKYLVDRKVELAMVSSSPREVVSKTMAKFDLARFFKTNCVFTREDYKREKPNPDPIALALKRLHYDAAQAVYVGDMREDIEAARKAKMKSVAVHREEGSYHILQHLEKEHPSFLIRNLKEIMRIVGEV
jgi:HAD superfamily hydrolase (TIGR01509 family)